MLNATDRPEISVILPAFNCEKFILDTLESLKNQTFRNFEILIIYDISSDQTVALIRDFAEREPRARCILNTSGKGLVGALNLGLAAARAPWIARIDADDVCLPKRLEKQLAYLQAHPDIRVLGSYFETFGSADGVVIRHPVDPLEVSYKFTWNTRVGHPTVVFDRELALRIGGYPEISAEDYGLFATMAMTNKISNLPEVLVKYRLHDSNKSMWEEQEILEDRVVIAGKAVQLLLGRVIDAQSYVRFQNGQSLPFGKALRSFAIGFAVLAKLGRKQGRLIDPRGWFLMTWLTVGMVKKVLKSVFANEPRF